MAAETSKPTPPEPRRFSLAYRKQFRYDDERLVSSWVEGGQERTYSHADWQAEQGQ